MSALSERTIRTCEQFKHALKSGIEPGDFVGYLSEREGVHRPAIWKRLRTGGALPDYNKGNPTGRKAAGIMDADSKADRIIPTRPPVYRDPCPRCGIRGDLPCGHSRVRLGMVL